MMILNKWQKEVLRDYGDGEFAHYAETDEISNPLVLGDTLLSFMLIELSEEEDCDSPEEGIKRLHRAHMDIQVAMTACNRIDDNLEKFKLKLVRNQSV
jgi:hypothetical protein